MSGPTARFVDNGGVRIHYLDSAPTGGVEPPPLVFVPGMSCMAEDYRAMLTVFDRRTIVADLRGHGRSDSPGSGYSFDHHVSDVAAIVDAVTDGPVHLMTFSRGTCYALGWAAAHPGRVLSMAIGDYPAREIALPAETADTFVAGRWRGRPVLERVTETSVRQTFADATSRPLWLELKALDVPTLVVRSTADAPLTDDDWARYRTDIPTAELVEFADSPHDLFRPERHRYAQLVAAHIERAEGP